MEHHNLINPVDKLGLEQTLHFLHHTRFHFIVICLRVPLGGKAKILGVHNALRARIGGHDQNGILKAHFSALRIRNMAIVEHLQQNIEHVWMCLLNLIKQHDRVRRSAHLLAELPAFLKAYIPRR